MPVGNSRSEPVRGCTDCSFDVTSAYEASEIASLQSTGSVPGFILGALSEGSVNCIWEPPPDSGVPVRHVEPEMTGGMPPVNGEGFYQSQSRVIALSHCDIMDAVSSMRELSTRSSTRDRVSRDKFLETYRIAFGLVGPSSDTSERIAIDFRARPLNYSREFGHLDLAPPYLVKSYTSY